MRVSRLIAVAALAILALIAVQLGCATTSMGSAPEVETVQGSPSFSLTESVFVNDDPTQMDFDFGKVRDVMKRYRANTQKPAGPIPMANVGRDDLADLPAKDLRMTWVGHSTLLLEFDGFRVLTDPVWSDRVSPFPSVGPKRFHKPAIALDDLPRIDAVIISHDHYDHLDHETIKQLAWRNVRFFVPLGVGAHLSRWGVRNYVELDWWEEAVIERAGRQMTLAATPARHFSGRGLLDRNKTLWASWVVQGDTHTVYFGGDTGYFDGFEKIGQKYGPFDAALMPIGAYDPAWSDIHLNPEEAVQAYKDLGSTGTFIPVHYATFNLAAHAWDEPMERLVAAVEEAGVSNYALPLPGQIVRSSDGALHQTWWRGLGR